MNIAAHDRARSAPAPDFECRRCLLSEMSDKQYYETVHDYVASLPEDIKTASDEYGRRIEICRACDDLINGMCRFCGCFVEARAAKKSNRCPKDDRIW